MNISGRIKGNNSEKIEKSYIFLVLFHPCFHSVMESNCRKKSLNALTNKTTIFKGPSDDVL